MSRAHTLADLPPVYWTVNLAGKGGLGLRADAQIDYEAEVQRQIDLGALALGLNRSVNVPVFVPFRRGRRNKPNPLNPRQAVACWDDFDPEHPIDRAMIALRKRQAFPVILGTGFPDAENEESRAWQLRQYVTNGFAAQVDDAMGRWEELGRAAEISGGVVIGETMMLNNPDKWVASSGLHISVYGAGISGIVRAGTFGRSALMAWAYPAPQRVTASSPCPCWLNVQDRDSISEEEIEEFRRLGYDRFILAGLEPDDPGAKVGRELLAAWRAKRPAPGTPTPPAKMGGEGER